VRHEPINALPMCIGCHRHVGENPIDHAELYREIFGQAQYDLLRELKERIVPKRDRPEKEIAKHYRHQLGAMKNLRDTGATGRIHVEGWL
jgi:cytochrome c553